MPDRTSNYQIAIDLIKEVSGQKNTITLPRIFLKIGGDVVVGLFLSQCVWYSDKGGSGDGWFFKSNKEWKEEIGLSYAQVKRATARLEEMGVLRTKLKKAKGAPTTHYYLDMDALAKAILDFLENQQSEGVENQKSQKTKDFSESEETITTLTPTSTETTLIDTPSDASLLPESPDPLATLPPAFDRHQAAVDAASGGKAADPITEIIKHLRWLCAGRDAGMPGKKEFRSYEKAARQLLEEKINTEDWRGVCQAIDDWSENPPKADVWKRDRTHDPHSALDCITDHYWRRVRPASKEEFVPVEAPPRAPGRGPHPCPPNSPPWTSSGKPS
jgi:hypothetical protein